MTQSLRGLGLRALQFLIYSLLAAAFLLVAGAGGLVMWRGHEISSRLLRSQGCREMRFVGVHANRGGCKATWDVGLGNVSIVFNSKGFRDPERTSRPKRGKLRVAVLGGSTILGLGIPENESTIGWLTERKLAERGVHDVEVLNLSVESFDIVKQMLRVPEYLELFHPDILLVESFRDYKVVRDSAIWRTLLRTPDGRPLRQPNVFEDYGPLSFVIGEFPRWMVHWIQKSLFVFRIVKESIRAHVVYKDELARTDGLMAAQVGAIRHMQELCGGNCKVAVFFDPRENVEERGSHEGSADEVPPFLKDLIFNVKLDAARKETLLKESGALYLDASGRLPLGTDDPSFIGQSRYYTARGMEFFSEALADSIAKTVRHRPSLEPTRRRR